MPAVIEHNLPPFLADWSTDHRAISDHHREQAGDYIMAIVARDATSGDLDPEAVRERARRLWVQFRVTYDELRGPYQRSEDEDVRRAMGQL